MCLYFATFYIPYTARVGVHRLSLRLPYLGIFPLALLQLILDFIRVSSLRPIYMHTSVDLPLTHFLGEFPGLELSVEPDVVVPEAEQGCAWSRNLDPNFCPGRGRGSGFGI